MRSIFSSLAEDNKISLTKEISIPNPKTKELLEVLKKIDFNKGLIIVSEMNSNLELASRNIPHIEIIDSKFIDPIKLLSHNSILISEDSLPKLEELFV